MDILDHLLLQEAEATRYLLSLCRGLSDEQWLRTFEFGQGSLYATFDHLIDSKEYWTSLLLGQPGPFVPAPADPARSQVGLARRLDAISPVFRAVARQRQEENRLGAMFVDHETGPAKRTYGACLVHVATHGLHHCAQIRIMFDLLGVTYDPFSGTALDAYPLAAHS